MERNLVFYRIPEVARAERVKIRRGEDEKRVRRVLNETGAITNAKFKFSRRICERQEDDQEARPLLVGFDSVQTKESIIDSSHRLSKPCQEGLNEVTIVPDLTTKQRMDEQDKVAETKRKNLARRAEEQSKNLVFKVGGGKGTKREILPPLLRGQRVHDLEREA